MQPLPQLESCLRLAFDARDPEHASGVSLASWFVRAPTRGRRRSDLDAALLFPPALRARMGPKADRAIAVAMDPASWRLCADPRATVPLATREWLAEAAMALGRAEGFDLTWAMLRAISELESAAQRLLGSRTPPSRPVRFRTGNAVLALGGPRGTALAAGGADLDAGDGGPLLLHAAGPCRERAPQPRRAIGRALRSLGGRGIRIAGMVARSHRRSGDPVAQRRRVVGRSARRAARGGVRAGPWNARWNLRARRFL